MGGAANIQAHGGVELQCVAARGGFRVAEHHADLLAQLVDEDAAAARLADGAGKFAQSFGHQARLKAYGAVRHFALDFSAWRECRDRVDDDEIDRTRSNEVVGDFERLLAVVGLRDQEIFGIHAEVFRVELVESMLRVHDGTNAASFLAFCDGVDGKRSFAGRFRTIDFHNAALGVTANAEREIQGQTAAGNHVHFFHRLISEFHYGAFAVRFVQSIHRQLEGFEFVCVYSHVNWF